MFKLILSLAVFALPATAFAQSQDTDIRPLANQLSKAEIMKTFKGQTFDGAYNFGRDGKAQSFYVEKHNPDGTVVYTEDGDTEPGRWFTRKTSLCFTYPNEEISGGCFRVYRVRNCYYFYSDRIPLASDELDRDYWTARAVPMGESPQCEALIG